MFKTAPSGPRTGVIVGIAAVTFAVALPQVVRAQVSCNTFIAIGIGPAGPVAPGGTKTVTLSLGTDGIQGGTQVTISNVRYELDCNATFPVAIPCTDQGDIFNYQGDATITTTCGSCLAGNLNAGASCAPAGPGGGCDAIIPGDNAGTCVPVVWISNVPAGGNATNDIVFSPSPPINIPANMFPYCDMSFDIKLDNLEPTMGPSSDATPTDVEIAAGFVGSDAVCDNTLPSEGSQSASIPTASGPVCGNGIVEAGETCDPPGSTPATPPGNTNVCRSDCTYCGDGMTNDSETCDDGNTVDTCSATDRCHNNCKRCLRKDPTTILLKSPTVVTERLRVHGRFEADHSVDPSTLVSAVRLSNANGDVYSAELPAGAVPLVRSGASFTMFRFRNPAAKSAPGGGITQFKVTLFRHWYRVWVEAYGDLSAATVPDMMVEVSLGHEEYTSSGPWKKTSKGWTFRAQ